MATKTKKKIYLEYKYPERHWQLYDQTQVYAWADTSERQMKLDFPGAEYRRRVK